MLITAATVGCTFAFAYLYDTAFPNVARSGTWHFWITVIAYSCFNASVVSWSIGRFLHEPPNKEDKRAMK